jgi:hypothetical protein
MAMIRAMLQQQVYMDPVVYDWAHIKSKAMVIDGTFDGADFSAAAKRTRRAARSAARARVLLGRSARHGRPEGLHYSEVFTAGHHLPIPAD